MCRLGRRLKRKRKLIFAAIGEISSSSYTKRMCRLLLGEWLSNKARTMNRRGWKAAPSDRAIWFAGRSRLGDRILLIDFVALNHRNFLHSDRLSLAIWLQFLHFPTTLCPGRLHLEPFLLTLLQNCYLWNSGEFTGKLASLLEMKTNSVD